MEDRSSVDGIILGLRRVVYRCELLERPELSDETRQSLWESVVSTLADVQQLRGCQQSTHELIRQERSRHAVLPNGGMVIPDGVSEEDVRTGCLAAPCVDPTAARSLAEGLITRLEADLRP